MKRLFFTLAIAALGFSGAYAQTSTPKQKLTAEQKAEKSSAKLQKELALTADQKQKVYAIELDKFKKAGILRESAKSANTAVKERHEGIKKDTEAKLAKVLTADQNKKLELIKAEKQEHHQGKRHHKGAQATDKI
jgi:protein CpxP